MKRAVFAAVAVLGVTWLGYAPSAHGQEPEFEPPTPAHKWLNQLVGEWKTESTAQSPDGETFKCEGTATATSLGGFWVIITIDNQMDGTTMRGVMTVGYDPKSKKYIGTWVDSMTSYLWKYEGSVDEAGKVLTLGAPGPNMLDPTSDKQLNFRDVFEIKGKDHLVLSGSVEAEPGKWTTFMTMNFERKK